MKRIFEAIKNNPLFKGIAFSDFERMLACLSAKTVNYKKDAVILLTGDTVDFVGLVISGGVKIVKEDANGRAILINGLGASELFAEVFACAEIDRSPVTVLAAEDAEIMLFNYRKIISTCGSACPFHSRLIENMLKLVAAKSLTLNRKIEILSKRTIRERLLIYFDMQREGRRKFTIPYSREELAGYLCVDRSAMSSELGKMRGEGLIKVQKNTIEIE